MKHVLIPSLIALSLSACGASNSFEADVFNIIETSEAVKLGKPISCSKAVAFENLSFNQRCFEYEGSIDASKVGVAFKKLGLDLTSMDSENFKIIERTSSRIILRHTSGIDCASYVVFQGIEKSNQTVEYGFSVTPESYCGKLSKVYTAIALSDL